jgi:protocatechuate 3,4-dioxygenase beta subunit
VGEYRSGARSPRVSGLWLGLVALTLTVPVGAQMPTQPRQPTPLQVPATAAIFGTVTAGDSGQPIDGVRVSLSGPEIRGSRSTFTDDDGRFAFVGLPAGRVTLTASKSGFVSITYGQPRPGPGQAGTPIALLAGQQLKDIRLQLPRGGVITGTVFDEKSRPLVGASVRVSRWVVQSGERVIVSAGSDSTDDRGRYRVFGLAPGSYVVHTTPRGTISIGADVRAALEQAEPQRIEILTNVTTLIRDQVITPASEDEPVTTGYAEVYYPGTSDLASAAPVFVAAGEERPGVDLRLERVTLGTISGQVVLPPGLAFSNLQVRLFRSDAAAGGTSNSTRAAQDGTFRISGVAPGRYRAVVVATPRRPASSVGGLPAAVPGATESTRYWGSTEVVVAGEEVPGVSLVLRPGAAVEGRVVFDGATVPPANLTRVRLTLTPTRLASSAGASPVSASVGRDGRFRLTGVVPGQYEIRASGASGWFADSALTGGRDALDFLFDVPPDAALSSVVVTFADRQATLSGTLQDQLAKATADYTVVLFAADPAYWVPRSRRIRATRPSTDGRFSFGDLPAGTYRLAAMTGVEPGAWFDPELLRQLAAASVPVTLGKGEAKTQDLRVTGR